MTAQTVSKPAVLHAPGASVQDEPHATEAERALLHAVLNGRDLGPALLEGLESQHFYRATYGWIYAAALELREAEKEIDPVSLAERLRERGELEHLTDGEHAGAALVKALKEAEIASSGAVRTYAKLIIEKHTRRLMLRSAEELIRAAGDERTPATVLIDRHVRTVTALRPFDLNREFVSGKDSDARHASLIKAQAERASWHAAPWKTMAERVPVINENDIIAVLGPEGSGKSVFCANWAQFDAAMGNKVAYIFTEMTEKQVLDRRAAGISRKVSYTKLQKPETMTDHDWLALGDAMNDIKEWMPNLDYWHSGPIASDRLLMVMQRMVDDFGTRMIVLDGLNDVEPVKERGENDTTAWRRLMMQFEDFTNRNLCVLLVSAQLNNEGNAYQIGKSLRQKASIFIKMKPERLETPMKFAFDGTNYGYLPGENHPRVTFDIEKHRNGARGTFDLCLVGPRYLWIDEPPGFGRVVDLGDDPGAGLATAQKVGETS